MTAVFIFRRTKGAQFSDFLKNFEKLRLCPGLFVMVTKSKNGNLSRSYVFRIKAKQKNYKFSIGSVEKVTLTDAKQIAKQLNGKFSLGEDVQAEYYKFRNYSPTPSGKEPDYDKISWTVERLILEWTEFQENRGVWKNRRKSQAQTILAWVKNHLSEPFRSKLATYVTTQEIADELHSCWLTHTSTPEKLLGALDGAFDWGIRFGHLKLGSNPAKSCYVRELLPGSHVRPKPEHFPYLSPERMPEFMQELMAVESIPAKCLAFQILCALRIDNARSSRWEQFNKEEKILKIQREEMKADFKNNPAHIIPISEQAYEILLSVPRVLSATGSWDDSFIFSNLLSGEHKPITEQSIYKTIKTLNGRREAMELEGWRDPDTRNRVGMPRLVVPHGLARTAFETWAMDPVTFKHPEFSPLVIDFIMDHQLDHYRGDYKRRPPIGAMREVLQCWADFLFAKTN